MIVGLIVFTIGQKALGARGLPPSMEVLNRKLGGILKIEYAIYGGTLLIVPVIVALFNQYHLMDYIMFGLGAVALVFILYTASQLESEAKFKLFAALVMIVFSAVFWAFYEQNAGSLNLFAMRNVNMNFFGIDLPALSANTFRRLPNDRPHQFKFDGSYTWPFALVTGASFRAQSGLPFNQLIPDPSGVYGNNEGFKVQRGTAINPVTGSNRTPVTYNLDFNAYYPIKFGESRQLRFQVDWFNVTNAQRAVREDETVEITTRLAGAPNVPNVFFGRGTIFQYPSALRLGAKFRF